MVSDGLVMGSETVQARRVLLSCNVENIGSSRWPLHVRCCQGRSGEQSSYSCLIWVVRATLPTRWAINQHIDVSICHVYTKNVKNKGWASQITHFPRLYRPCVASLVVAVWSTDQPVPCNFRQDHDGKQVRLRREEHIDVPPSGAHFGVL